ncbi:adenosine receptor A3-like [Antedon mediterranea]|uniref:adenosine receptor A3-like n=1 Tax=Antedon mediterranea TaxID=105859 RepID=UPI003AF42101
MATVDLRIQNNVSMDLLIFVSCLSIPLLLTIIIGNTIVIVTVYTKRGLRRLPSNIFISSLAVTDLLNGLIGLPLSIIGYILRRQFLYSVNCAIWYFVPCVILIHVSVLHLIVITFDRFIAVKYPFRYHVWMSSGKAFKTCIYVSLIGILIGGSPFVSAGVASIFVPTPNVTFEYECGGSALFNIYGAPVFYYFTHPITGLTIPCLFVVYAYIFLIASKAELKTAKQSGKNVTRREMKVTKTTAIVLLVYTLCIAPSALKHFIQGYIDNGYTWLAWYPWFSDYIGIANSMMNPFIYAGRSKEMRKEFIKTVRNVCSCLKVSGIRKNDVQQWTSSTISVSEQTSNSRPHT